MNFNDEVNEEVTKFISGRVLRKRLSKVDGAPAKNHQSRWRFFRKVTEGSRVGLLLSYRAHSLVADRKMRPRYGWYRKNEIPEVDRN